MKLYAVFATGPNDKYEDFIVDDINMETFEKVIKPHLEQKGYTGIRILLIDNSPPDFVGTLDPCFVGKCRT